MMKLVSMLLTLCMVFCMLTVPAAADDLPVVKLDVGTTETYDDTNYKVDANTIILRAEDRVYELTGTTDRKILVPVCFLLFIHRGYMDYRQKDSGSGH